MKGEAYYVLCCAMFSLAVLRAVVLFLPRCCAALLLVPQRRGRLTRCSLPLSGLAPPRRCDGSERHEVLAARAMRYTFLCRAVLRCAALCSTQLSSDTLSFAFLSSLLCWLLLCSAVLRSALSLLCCAAPCCADAVLSTPLPREAGHQRDRGIHSKRSRRRA